MPDNVPTGWDHVEDDSERTLRDASRDYQPGVAIYPTLSPNPQLVPAATPFVASEAEDEVQADEPAAVVTGPTVVVDGYTSAETAAIRRFLLDAGVLGANDGMTTIAEMRGFVHGRMR